MMSVCVYVSNVIPSELSDRKRFIPSALVGFRDGSMAV